MVVISLFIFQLSLTQVLSDKCYAATMEGGGPLGAYEAGCMVALTEFVPLSELGYKIIGGISIGSYNTCWCAGYEIGDERNMALNLKKIWTTVKKQSEIFSFWFPGIFRGGILAGFFFRSGAVNNAASYDYIANNMGSEIKRNVTVGATNMNTGSLENFNESLGIEYLPRACWASGAYMGLPPVSFLDESYVDGCATQNMNANAVVNRCKEMGYQDSDIVLDIYYDLYRGKPPVVKMNNTRDTMSRIDTLKTLNDNYWYIQHFYKEYPKVNVRYSMFPSQELFLASKLITLKAHGLDVNYFKYEYALGYNDTLKLLGKTQQEREEAYKKSFMSDD